jgi:SAM-dependent methyltransferase
MPGVGDDGCPACGSGRLAQLRLARSSDPRSARAQYPVGRCDGCGSEAVLTPPDEGDGSLYVGGSYARPPKLVDRILEPLRRVGDRSVLSIAGDLPTGSQVIDVGAGDGRNAALFRRRGCEVTAVDPFSEAVIPGDVVREYAETVTLPSGSADLVLLWHVLEHLDNPESVLRRMRTAVRPGGTLVLSVPRLDSLQGRIGGDRWFHQDVPRHRLHYTKAGALQLLQRTGFAPMAQSGFSPEQGLLGMVQTILNRITREQNVAFRALKKDFQRVTARDLLLTALALLPAALFGVIAELVASLFGRGGTLVIRATPASRL